MDSNIVGETSKLIVQADLLKRGLEPCRACGNFTAFDFMLDINGQAVKIKTKTASRVGKSLYVHVPKSGNFHVLAVVDVISGNVSYTPEIPLAF